MYRGMIAMLFTVWCTACGLGLLQRASHFTSHQLQRKVDGIFPVEERKGLVRARFTQPQILLRPGTDRIGLSLDVQIRLPGGKKMDGSLILGSALQYESSRGEILLADPLIEDVQIDGVPKRFEDLIHTLSKVVAKRYLAQIPIDRLQADDVEESLAKLVLRSVTVQDGEVVVVLGL